MTTDEMTQWDYYHFEEIKNHFNQTHNKVADFTKEIISDDPDWVAARRVEYLLSEVDRLISEANLWGLRAYRRKNILGDAIIEVIVRPLKKQVVKYRKEIDLYQNPVVINYNHKITENDIEHAKNVNCADILETNGRRWAICPFHDDKNPSLYLYPAERGYHCFSCKASGDAIDLVQKLYNYSFPEAVRYLSRF